MVDNSAGISPKYSNLSVALSLSLSLSVSLCHLSSYQLSFRSLPAHPISSNNPPNTWIQHDVTHTHTHTHTHVVVYINLVRSFAEVELSPAATLHLQVITSTGLSSLYLSQLVRYLSSCPPIYNGLSSPTGLYWFLLSIVLKMVSTVLSTMLSFSADLSSTGLSFYRSHLC